MNKKFLTLSLAVAMAGTLASCNNGEQKAQANADTEVHGIDVKNMDQSVSPSDDFYNFANGGWQKATKIPDDQTRWGAFNELRDRNVSAQKNIMDDAIKHIDTYTGDQLKAVQVYQLGMDSAKIETAGYKALEPIFAKINSVSNKQQVPSLLGELNAQGVYGLFTSYVYTDSKNSTENAFWFRQGGLSLPDRDYYLNKDEHFKSIRQDYVKYISAILTKVGEKPAVAEKAAKDILAFETKLAEISRSRAELRNPEKNYNKMKTADFDKSFSHFDVTDFFQAAKIPQAKVPEVIVGQPEFFTGLGRILKTTSVNTLKQYFTFKTVNTYASYLSHDFVTLSFDFYGKKLSGAKVMRPRWKRMLSVVNGVVGEGFGQMYVAKVFPEEAKTMLAGMIENVRTVLGQRIDQLSWMSEKTKEKAHEKLENINVKIGYPNKWKSYEDLNVDTSSFLQTMINSNEFDYQDMIGDLGKPVDKTKWGMTPQTVNAYYSPTNNEIVFPAAILQPPFYDYKADKAVNYGGIGAVIGHEITHGFDDQGRKYDAQGNQKDWWTEEDGKRFDALAHKVTEQFNNYTVLDSVHVNGQLTLGENIADLGGVTLAYNAMMNDMKKNGRQEKIDGFTPEQRFFLSWATVWRTKARDEALRQQVMTDPHSPGFFRAYAPLSNFEPFQKAFDLKNDSKMVRKDRIVIW